jgi:hypothetical protein
MGPTHVVSLRVWCQLDGFQSLLRVELDQLVRIILATDKYAVYYFLLARNITNF